MSLRHAWAVLGLGTVILLGTLPAGAQFPAGKGAKQQPQGKQPPAKPEPANFQGSLEGAASGFLKAVSGNETVFLQVGPNSKLRVTGAAQLDYLQPGILIQFHALLDKPKLKLKEKVDKLTVVTAAPPEISPGALPDAGVTGEGDFKAVVICGMITSIKGETITLNVPGLSPKLHVDLEETPSIDVNIGDLTKANQGDAVEVQGMKMVNGQNTIIQVRDGKITMAQPLSGAAKKKVPAKPAKPSKRSKPSE